VHDKKAVGITISKTNTKKLQVIDVVGSSIADISDDTATDGNGGATNKRKINSRGKDKAKSIVEG
jgi:hypothetical protein